MTPIPSHLVFPLTVEELRAHWKWSKRQLDDFLRQHPYYRGARRTRLIFSDHYVRLVEALAMRYQHVVSGEAARGADKLPVVGRAALVPGKKESA